MSLLRQLKEAMIKDLNLQNVTPETIGDDMPIFKEGLGLDSLDAMELVVLVKKHFGVEITSPEEGREAFASVAALAKHIESHR